MTLEQFLILLGIVVGIILLYVGTMYLNKAVAVPESCKAAYLEAQNCETCASKGMCNIDEQKFQDAIEYMKEVKL